jgi:adhesin/invasin
VLVADAAADHFLLVAPAQVVSGIAFDITVIVQDAFNNPVLTYQGTVQFATSDGDPGVVLPPDYTFSSADAGVHTFAEGVTLFTVGQQMLSVNDPSLGIAAQVVIDVTAPGAPPGGAAHGPDDSPFWPGLAVISPDLLLPRSPILSPFGGKVRR